MIILLPVLITFSRSSAPRWSVLYEAAPLFKQTRGIS